MYIPYSVILIQSFGLFPKSVFDQVLIFSAKGMQLVAEEYKGGTVELS